MNNKIVVLAFMMFNIVNNAQQMTDVIRISDTKINGTARYTAMGGAFGALGGDISAVAINPASSAVFNASYATGTIGITNKKINSSYFTHKEDNISNPFDLDQLGVVLAFDNKDDDWSRTAVVLNINTDNAFRENYMMAGRNTQASVINYFKSIADDAHIPLSLVRTQSGETIADLYQYLGENESYDAQQVFLGYNSYLLDPLDATDANNTTYIPADNYMSSDQKMFITSTGTNSKFTMNFGAAYKKKTYLGASVHVLSYEYKQEAKYTESGVGASTIKSVQFDNKLTTKGEGISFSLGVIQRFTDYIRIGLTYDSPKYYTISDELVQSLETVRNDGGNLITQLVAPEITNVYLDYKLIVPSKMRASAALVVGQQGLISADYSYQNKANIIMKPKADFETVNQDIKTNLRAVSTFKLGTEWRLGLMSVRAGYTLEQSPYKNLAVRGDLISYSAGLGYRFEGITIDVAYKNSSYNDSHQFFSTGLTNAALLSRTNNQFLLTAKFEL